MFCSKCGKTLMPEDQQCPHCGNPIGESRFAGTQYTSAQPHILPNAPAGQAVANYTKTSYTTMSDAQQQEGSVDSRTTYRPVYDDASAPEEIRQDMRAALAGDDKAAADEAEQSAPDRLPEELSDDAINTLNAVEEELKMDSVDTSELHSRPIESTGRAGISAGVEDYIQKLEATQSRRAARRRRAVDEGEDSYATPRENKVYGETQEVDPDIDTEQSEVFDDIGEDEFDEIRYGKAFGAKEILKVALIIAIAVGAFALVWSVFGNGSLFGGRSGNNNSVAAKAGITESLYAEGMDLIREHASDEYIQNLQTVYRSQGPVEMAKQASQGRAVISALKPAAGAEASENDALFVDALLKIDQNIGNVVANYMQASTNGAANAQSDYDAGMQTVSDAILQLETASGADSVQAVAQGATISAAATPTPTPEPVLEYQTLQKKSKGVEVLEMQNRLYELGYLDGDRDGEFGNVTQTAVKLFQQDAGLEVTGIADNETLTLLYSENAPRTENAQITPTPRPTQAPDA